MHCFHKSLLHLLVVKQSNKDQKMKHERSSAIETCSIQCVKAKSALAGQAELSRPVCEDFSSQGTSRVL